MDVDIIFRRGYAYTLATLCVLAAFYGIVFSLGSLVQAELPGPGQHRPDDRDADRRVPVPADPQLDSGAAGPPLLPRPLRLPPHAGRVRPRAELGNRSGHDARHRWPTACCRRSASGTWRSSWPDEGDGGAGLPPEDGHGPESAPGRGELRRAGPELPELEAARAVPVLRAHPPSAGRGLARLAGLGAPDHRRSGSDLLPALHGPRPHHRLPRREPHRRRRLPLERRRGAAAHALRLRRHRHRERARSTARCSARWTSTSG